MLVLHIVLQGWHIEVMEATVNSFQVEEEFERGHGGVKHYRFPELADPCVFYDRRYKVAVFAFGGVKEDLICYSCHVHGFLAGTTFLELFGVVSS